MTIAPIMDALPLSKKRIHRTDDCHLPPKKRRLVMPVGAWVRPGRVLRRAPPPVDTPAAE